MKNGILIAAAVAGIGLYFWFSGDWRRIVDRLSPMPVPPIPPGLGALSLQPGAPQPPGMGF